LNLYWCLFFFEVLDLDFNSAFTTSTSFGWLLLISSGSTDRLVLFCISLVYETALCGPLRGPGQLFDPFPTICNCFNIILVCFGSIIKELTHFSFIGSSTSSSFWIRSGKYPLM